MSVPKLDALDPAAQAAVYAHIGESAPRIRVMDDVTLFDYHKFAADAAGVMAINHTFFSTSKGQHPLGEDACNVETAGQVPESKLYIARGLRVSFEVIDFPELDPEAKIQAIETGERVLKSAIVTSKEGTDRQIERGCVYDFPAGVNFLTRAVGIVDNPAAAGPYLAQIPHPQNGADLYGASHRWSIPWVLPSKRQFAVKIASAQSTDFGGEDYAGISCLTRVAMDCTVLTFV